MTDDDYPLQRVTTTVELPGWPGVHNIAIGALIDVLDHLERDGIRPFHTTINITEQTTT
jgi:hypothetical protein